MSFFDLRYISFTATVHQPANEAGEAKKGLKQQGMKENETFPRRFGFLKIISTLKGEIDV